jgi:disulfide bond formation protein DsbB
MRVIVVSLAGLGVAGQLLAAALLLMAMLDTIGLRAPLASFRARVKGFELWFASFVAIVATGGSLFFSEVAHFPPCLLCWYERGCMYPLSIATLIAAASGFHKASRWLLPLPVAGAGLSIYHLLIENGIVSQTLGCWLSAPGGCGLMWINEFGYVTLPTLALTAFVLVVEFLVLDITGGPRPATEAA